MSHDPHNQFTEVADVYDSLMSVVPYGYWVDYVERLWQRFELSPRRVLDLACGTGNVLLELLRRGYDGEGADASAAMLHVARRKIPEQVPLWCQDARVLELGGEPFDACVCLFDSLNYLLSPADLRRAFAAVRRNLAPGGTMLFDMNAIRALETGMFDQKGTGSDASLEYEWHSAWERASRLCTIRMEFRVHGRDGTRVLHETHVQRGYSADEIRAALGEARFEVLGFFDAFTTQPPNFRTDRYHVIARAVDQ
ncbi:MAG: Methylase involved in ubiquinone/menaquinone biosynthesis [Armatimonadetes bacterium]|jgi:ubiquinone/menaquinone biosynthesis C-methylase UbiE|nr:Methylase involved in ubiquinone/menaquinone biosynthesis [Armatimonadota bacterium]